MTANPYLITGPALISFSGGRTSGYMLNHILDAHGGSLPADVHVAFFNTGRERPETYRFIRDCARHWSVPVMWLERRINDPAGFEVVGENSHDTSGRVLSEIIENRSFLPNGVSRFCTTESKIMVGKLYMLSLGYEHWTNVIGLRVDEPKRVNKTLRRNAAGKERYLSVMPLNSAMVDKREVLFWWKQQQFDLELPSDAFGNCDLCHLKHRCKILEVLLTDIHAGDWWVSEEIKISGKTEKPSGARFRRNGPGYAELQDYVRRYPDAARAEVARFRESERIAAATGDLFDQVDGESVDCHCTD